MIKSDYPAIVAALRATAAQLERSEDYQWGHMGACNCGFLAQVVTRLSRKEIHSYAMTGHGDWSEQLNDYCPSSGLPMDGLISALLEFGFDRDELAHLERLSSPSILRRFALKDRNLKHNDKADVIKYMNAWADMLEEESVQDSEFRISEMEFEPMTVS